MATLTLLTQPTAVPLGEDSGDAMATAREVLETASIALEVIVIDRAGNLLARVTDDG